MPIRNFLENFGLDPWLREVNGLWLQSYCLPTIGNARSGKEIKKKKKEGI